MPEKKGHTVLGVLVSLSLLAFIIFLSASKVPSQLIPLIFILVPIVTVTVFINTDVALILLIFSMLLSPELKIAEVPQKSVVVRIDDILLFVVFFSWLAKTAMNKKLGLLKSTPLNTPIIAYILVYIVSTCIGILTGHLYPLICFFYIVKYIEYFMLYFLVTNNIRDKEQIKSFMASFFIVCALVCSYALLTLEKAGGRASAPFEGSKTEPNTLGGYLVFLFAIATGIFLYSRSKRWWFSCMALACFAFIALVYTLSRSSYIGFIAMYLTFIVLSKRKKFLLIWLLILGIVILPFLLPANVTERVTMTFVPGMKYEALGKEINLDYSAAARVESWKDGLNKWTSRPFLGYGVTGVGLLDSQYPRVLGETGIIGFWIFMWLIIAIFRCSLQVFNNLEDDWFRGLVLGFLSGFVGLLVHSFGANTFIIVRIMEPFWFLAAVVVMLPGIIKSSGSENNLIQR